MNAEKKVKGVIIRLALIIVGALLILDTLFVSTVSNFNLGVIMPAILGAPLLVCGLFYPLLLRIFASGGWGVALKWFIIGGYTLFIAAFLITLAFILGSAMQSAPSNADAIVVLGSGVRGTRVTRTLAERLNTAKKYYEDNPETLIIVSGGQGAGEDVTEASAMRKYLVERGVPESSIVMEEASTSTQENFRFSKPIIEQRFGENATIVFTTNYFHVFRSEKVALKEGVQAKGIGCPTMWYIAPNCYLREAVAIWEYLIKGKM